MFDFKMPVKIDKYGWDKWHIMSKDERSFFRRLLKIYHLTFSPNAEESGSALKKFRELLRDNPYGYLPEYLDQEVPDFRKNFYVKRPVMLAEELTAARIKKFNTTEPKAETHPVTNKNALALIHLLTFMGWLHKFADKKDRDRKKFWLTYDQMMILIPGLRKNSGKGDSQSSLRSLYYREIRDNGFPLFASTIRRKSSGGKTKQGYKEVWATIIDVDKLLKKNPKPLMITYQVIEAKKRAGISPGPPLVGS